MEPPGSKARQMLKTGKIAQQAVEPWPAAKASYIVKALKTGLEGDRSARGSIGIAWGFLSLDYEDKVAAMYQRAAVLPSPFNVTSSPRDTKFV